MQMLGVFWKIQDICYQMGTDIFKIEVEMTENMKHEVANPPLKKWAEFFALNIRCRKLLFSLNCHNLAQNFPKIASCWGNLQDLLMMMGFLKLMHPELRH